MGRQRHGRSRFCWGWGITGKTEIAGGCVPWVENPVEKNAEDSSPEGNTRKHLGLLWQPKFPAGSRPFPWANLPRAILTRAKFVRPLAAHQGADRSPLPSVFREEEIHYSLGREGFPVRLASHRSIRPPSREAARVP